VRYPSRISTVVVFPAPFGPRNAKSASGTITFSQKIAGPGGHNNSCGPYEVKFTATTK